LDFWGLDSLNLFGLWSSDPYFFTQKLLKNLRRSQKNAKVIVLMEIKF